MWRGRPLIVALAESLAPAVSSITVVSKAEDDYADLGFRSIHDLVPGQGPLGGLQAALNDSRTEWLAVAACDWAGLRPEWLSLLQSAATPETQCVCFGAADAPDPLFAIYHASARKQVDQRLKAGDRAMRGLVCSLRHRILSPPPGWEAAVNVNRQEDLSPLNG